MWKIYVNISWVQIVVVTCAVAQGYVPSNALPNQSQTQNTQMGYGFSAPSSGSFESETFQKMALNAFDPTSDSMDFQEGSFQWKGRSFQLANQRVFRARFERFLLASPAEDVFAYGQVLQQVEELLSVGNLPDAETLSQAWNLLFKASEYDRDGGNASIVANQVFNAWRIRQEMRGKAITEVELQRVRSVQQEIVANRNRVVERLKEQKIRETVTKEKNAAVTKEIDSSQSGQEAYFRALDLAETEAKIALLESQAAATAIQAKLQFQSQIVSFMMQRRFHHAQILASFYQLLFKGSQQKLEVGKEELNAFIPNSDLSLTVDSLLFMAREAINDVRVGVDAVLTAESEGRRLIALERVQETFFLGEHLLELDRIPTHQRRQFLDLYRSMLEAQELANVKDYQGLREMIGTLEALAQDFPAGRMRASIDSAMSVSDMAVFAAAQYRNAGDIKSAREELANAIKVWPTNPTIRDFQTETNRLATASSQGVQIFDDLLKRGDRRGIYTNRMELGFSLANDDQRKQELMQVVDVIARVDLLIAQSEEMANQGDYFAAWELIQLAFEADADDAPMNRVRAKLAPRVAKFVGLLDRALDADAENRYAAALNNYLIAQDIYPASRICRIGIERVSQSVLNMAADQMHANHL
jgi:tetratricopeptide (TPR) repeat protein